MTNTNDMNQLLNDAILTNFKGSRIRAHKQIKSDSKRYTTRRIGKNRTENRWDSVSANDDYTNDVVNAIFNLIPDLKGSGAFTGYVRYSLTNRWPNRFHFNKKTINSLIDYVNSNNNEKELEILNHLVFTGKISKNDKVSFLSNNVEKKNQILLEWKTKKAITNKLYNKDNALEFLNADKQQQLKILMHWSTITLPTTTPSAFIVKYCLDSQSINNMINTAQEVHTNVDDDSIDRQLKNGKFEKDAIIDGITDEDKQLFRKIISALHDSHKDIRDCTSKELDEYNNEWNNLLDGDDLYKEEDWSNIDWDAEE